MASHVDLTDDRISAFVARARVDCDKLFEYRCPRYWGSLTETHDPMVRDCWQCNESVYLVTSEAEFADRARRRECVAVILPDELPDPDNLPDDAAEVQQQRMIMLGRVSSDDW